MLAYEQSQHGGEYKVHNNSLNAPNFSKNQFSSQGI